MVESGSDLSAGNGELVRADDIDSWPVVFFIGLITLALGVIVLVWPSETLKVLSIVVGIQVLLFGIFRLISAFSSNAAAPGLVGFIGVIGMVVGVAVLRHPFEAVAVLAVLLGVVWIVGGSIEFIGALVEAGRPNRGLAAFSAALSIGAGVLVVSWPAPTVTVVAWISGLYLAGFGFVLCVTAFAIRSAESSR